MPIGPRSTACLSLQAGCDYLGSEAIGVRGGTLDAVAYPTPLRLDADNRTAMGIPASRFPQIPAPEVREDVEILHGDHGPVGGLLFVDCRPDRSATAELLDPSAALQALLALNLGRVGDPAADPVRPWPRTRPPSGSPTMIQQRSHTTWWPPVCPRSAKTWTVPSATNERLHDTAVVREHADTVVRRAVGVDWAAIEADREPSAVLRPPSAPTCGLTGPALALWRGLESGTTFERLVRATADSEGGSDGRAAPDVAWLLSQFERCGLLALDDAASGVSPLAELAECSHLTARRRRPGPPF